MSESRSCEVSYCTNLAGRTNLCMMHYITETASPVAQEKVKESHHRAKRDELYSTQPDPEEWLKKAKEKELKIARRFAK